MSNIKNQAEEQAEIDVVPQKDPNGLIQRDIDYLERIILKRPYQVGDSIESVAYRAGQRDLLDFIKTKMIGRAKSGPIQ